MISMEEYSVAEIILLLGTILLVSLLVAEVFDWTHFFSGYDKSLCRYGYQPHNGPVTWKQLFPSSRSQFQSPINIATNCTLSIPTETLTTLLFSPNYHELPKDVRMYNDSHSVTVFARWCNDARPTISGGPLTDSYQFFNARFRWGPNDAEGSEHTIDSQRYAMELQALHVKVDCKFDDIRAAVEANAVLIISYLFEIIPYDNPYLEPIINSLKKIRCPYTCCSLEPLPLAWLVVPFQRKYFSYCGSLTYPPCTEGVQWLIQPEPLGVSSNQVQKFRKLMSMSGPLEQNVRPVQNINSRDIFFYE